MHMSKESCRPDQLPESCLERRVYEKKPTCQRICCGQAMVGQGAEFLFIIGSASGSDRRCQGAGKIAGCPCLRSRMDSTPGDEIEGGAVLNVAAEKERGARDECWKPINDGQWSRIGLEI